MRENLSISFDLIQALVMQNARLQANAYRNIRPKLYQEVLWSLLTASEMLFNSASCNLYFVINCSFLNISTSNTLLHILFQIFT